MGHVYNIKKQFKVQIIVILEEIYSFYWPKMHLWKGDKKFGEGPSPPHPLLEKIQKNSTIFSGCPPLCVIRSLKFKVLTNNRKEGKKSEGIDYWLPFQWRIIFHSSCLVTDMLDIWFFKVRKWFWKLHWSEFCSGLRINLGFWLLSQLVPSKCLPFIDAYLANNLLYVQK